MHTWFKFFLLYFELRPEISNNVVCATSKASDPPGQSGSLIRAFASRLTILTEHHLEFLSLKAAQARLSLHLSKCHIAGNHISRLIY